jgi:hypothetical protein
MQDGSLPITHVDLTIAQVTRLREGETLTVLDRDGDEVTIDGSKLDRDGIDMVLDGYPEQLCDGEKDIEIYLDQEG